MIVVFDLDGTLIDSAPDIHAAGNGALAEFGFAPVTLEQARSFVGHGAPVFVRRMMAALDLPDEGDLHGRLLAAFLERYETAHHLTTLYPGVRQALAALSGAGARLGLCTNKPHGPTLSVLDHFDMGETFEVVLGGDSLPVRKPDPTPLLHVVEAMGGGAVSGGAAVFVGDSEVDAETAERAGLPFALYTPGYRKTPVEQLPHRWAFDHFDALPAIVASARTAPAAG